MINSLFFHRDNIAEFKKQYYKDLLSKENINSNEIHINILSYEDGEKDETANFWGYKLEKNGTKYLFPSRDKHSKVVDLSKTFPIRVTNSIKVAAQREAYVLVQDFNVARIQSLKKYDINKLIDYMCCFSHENKVHQKISACITLAQMFFRVNARKSTPPGFGKDSEVDIVGGMLGDATTILSPTYAKLEYLTPYKLIAINEAVNISRTDWRIIEQFLLDCGAFKNEIAKHSRAISGGVGEFLNIERLSLALLYNDIDCYPDYTKYLDNVATNQLLDRFPPFRFWGRLDEDWTKIHSIDIEKYIKKNIDEYKDFNYTFQYYKDEWDKEIKGYKTTLFDGFPPRWRFNIDLILRIFDLMSKSHEEFIYWCNELKNCMIDYDAMLEYPKRVQGLAIRLSIPKEEVSKFQIITDIISWIYKNKKDINGNIPQEWRDVIYYCEKIDKENTFISKNHLIANYNKKDKIIKEENTKWW